MASRPKRGRYCAAAWCSHYNGCRIDKPYSFFSFPRDGERFSQWVKFCLREDLLGKTPENRRSYRLCSAHFHESQILRTHPRVELRSNAIPTIVTEMPSQDVSSMTTSNILYSEGTVLEVDMSALNNSSATHDETMEEDPPPKTTCVATGGWDVHSVVDMNVAGPSTAHTEDNIEDPPSSWTPIQRTPQKETPQKRKRSSCKSQPTPRTTARIRRIKRNLSLARSKLFRNNLAHGKEKVVTRQKEVSRVLKSAAKLMTTNTFNLFKLQLQFSQISKYGRRYPSQYKNFALNLYYHSPKTYRFLRKTLYLPSVTTLLNWQKCVTVKPGIDINTLSALKDKAMKTSERQCVALVMDEISIKEHLQYDSKTDSVVGFCNDGLRQTAMIGTHCLVFMVKGISHKWKQALGYWVTNEKNKSSVSDLLVAVNKCIDSLQDINYAVKVLICDQSPHNQAVCSQLGVTIDTPFFLRGEEKIFFMYDTPHLLKSLRNNLVNYDFNYNGNIVKWSHFKALYEHVDPFKLKLIPKITKEHVEVRAFKKMKVKLAVQVFSDSVSVAMQTFVRMGALPPEASSTATFFENVDKAFDTLNSAQTRKHQYKLRYAISEGSENYKFLEVFYETLLKSNFIGCRRQPPCLKGWLLNINCVFGLCKDLKENFSTAEICTRSINQDCLENLFSVIRQQHGCSSNPTVAQFSKGFKHTILSTLPKLSPSSNCEMDVEYVFSKVGEFLKTHQNIESDCEQDKEEEMPDFSNINLEVTDELEKNTIYYVSGYLCMHYLKHHVCENCSGILTEDENGRTFEENHQYFTFLKAYDAIGKDFGGLTLPKKEVFDVIGKWELMFQAIFERVKHVEKVCFRIKTLFEEHPNFETVKLCSQRSTEMFLVHFIRIRVLWGIRFLNRERLAQKVKRLRNHPGRNMLHTMHL